MMLASLMSVSRKAQIANDFKTIGEYGCSNQLQEFQLTSWLRVDLFFPNEYPWCPYGNSSIDWVHDVNMDW
jgi:hypothetical protein